MSSSLTNSFWSPSQQSIYKVCFTVTWKSNGHGLCQVIQLYSVDAEWNFFMWDVKQKVMTLTRSASWCKWVTLIVRCTPSPRNFIFCHLESLTGVCFERERKLLWVSPHHLWWTSTLRNQIYRQTGEQSNQSEVPREERTVETMLSLWETMDVPISLFCWTSTSTDI